MREFNLTCLLRQRNIRHARQVPQTRRVCLQALEQKNCHDRQLACIALLETTSIHERGATPQTFAARLCNADVGSEPRFSPRRISLTCDRWVRSEWKLTELNAQMECRPHQAITSGRFGAM